MSPARIIAARRVPDFAAEFDDTRAHFLYHRHQLESADMRFADIHDFFRRTGFDKLTHDFTAIMFRIFDLAVKFAIRESAGTAFTKLHVGFRIQRFFPPEAERIFGALAYFFAAFENDWIKAHFCQQ